jgi:hypothetical protein
MITIPACAQIWIPSGVTDLRGVNRRRSARSLPTVSPTVILVLAALQRRLISGAPNFLSANLVWIGRHVLKPFPSGLVFTPIVGPRGTESGNRYSDSSHAFRCAARRHNLRSRHVDSSEAAGHRANGFRDCRPKRRELRFWAVSAGEIVILYAPGMCPTQLTSHADPSWSAFRPSCTCSPAALCRL